MSAIKSFAAFRQLLGSKVRGRKPFKRLAIAERQLQDLADKRIERLIWTHPSQHTKSTTADEYAAYLIGRDPLIRIIVAAYSTKASRKHSRNVRRILRSPEFAQFFGWTPVFTKDTEDDWQLAWPGQEGSATYLARSIESPALGETADFLLIDDALAGGLKNASPQKQDRAYDAIGNVLMQRLTPGAGVLVISTLWTESDPPLRLWGDWRSSKVPARYLNLAALNPDGQSSFLWDIREPEPRPIEAYEVLWEEYRGLAFIEAKMREMDYADFETQYQGRPTGGGGSVEKGAWKWYDRLPPNALYGLLICDTGSELGDHNDPTLILGLAVYSDGTYVADAVQGRWEVDEMATQYMALGERLARALGARSPQEYAYKVPLGIIEKAALGRALHSELIKRGMPPMMVQLCGTQGKSKEIRAREQIHHILNGKVFLPKNASFAKELVRQWFVFPRGGNHDEYVDCLSYGLYYSPVARVALEGITRLFGPYQEPGVQLEGDITRQLLGDGDLDISLSRGWEEWDKDLSVGYEPLSPATQRAVERWEKNRG
jgi:predicted phage terminase large subunit-like protein